VDSSTEEQEEEQGESAEEPKFDKEKTSERFNILTQHNRELKEKLEEMEAWKMEIEQERSQHNEQEEKSQIPEWFSNVMGENEEAWQGFLGMTEKMQDQVLSKIESQSTQAQREEQENIEQGEKWVSSQLELVKETHGELSESDMNKLMLVVEKYVPSDGDGNLDFLKGYELMKVLNPKSSDTRKRLTDTENSSRTIDTEGYQGLIRVI